MMLSASISSINKSSSGVVPTLVRSLNGEWYKFQRHNIPFTINNTSVGTGTWDWRILDLGDNSIYTTSSQKNPEFTLPVGNYLVYLSTQGLNPDPVARVFWDKRITVLPEMFTSGEADIILNLDDGNNIIDASGWGDNVKVYCNKLDATVGRIRINDYTGTGAHILVDEPMTIDTFAGSSGLYFVNCQNIIFDAVGLTDQYYVTLDGIGVNTSHGIVLNTTSDIRCEFIEIYGVDIQVTQSGASGIRVLGDESATYNRNDSPCDGLKFAHIKGQCGHEFLYFGFTNDTDGGFGGPRQFINTQAWDIHVETCGRDPIQPCNQINCIIHNVIIDECATLGEPSHNSYVVHNAGNQNIKIFNIIGRGGVHGISMQFGVTGTLPMIWNCLFELETLASQSAWDFLQSDAGVTTDLGIMNVTNICNTGDEIVYRLDTSGGNTRDIDRLTLINIASLKGTSGNFWTLDGSQTQTNWDRTSGNLSYIPADWADALLDADGYIDDIASPLISGGVAMSTRYDYSDFLGEYDSLTFQTDIFGYVLGLDSEYPTGFDGGIELKLAALT